ncbi:MAG: hypothetical protein DI551_06765 [Micavibrio aeruginosavorus]|uniref:Dienelactone hydrolase domain-containing protein n=1 Tax=Micavibrio aeruginosavorus TaxID=349221 RepID=A0A2W5MWS9_9BACT|nr:MAG: hypothetical protein DI551_06765 [Micavibrio aeruginosavorus]
MSGVRPSQRPPFPLMDIAGTIWDMKYVLILLCLLMASPVHAQEQREPLKKEKQRQPNVEIWLPPEFQSSEQKWPLIIFSHGFGGCAKETGFLMSYLAESGYIVIAPDHGDARCDRGAGSVGLVQPLRAGAMDWPEKPFRNPEAWTDKTEADRRDDVLFALSSMLDDRQYKNYVDTDKIGLIGYSLGGYTVMGLTGAWPSWKDKRFKAALVLSPYAAPFLKKNTIKNIGVPVMYQGGTRDMDLTPLMKRRGGVYDSTPSPKYFIEYEGAGHLSFTELEKSYQPLIDKTALGFFDKYLKGKDIVIDEAKTPKVADFRKDEGGGKPVSKGNGLKP